MNVRLVQPTDFEILDALSDGRRNTAVNLAVILDKDRDYINTRLPALADYGLVEKVGPAQRSGLYVITEAGQTALSLREQYSDAEDFAELLEHRSPGQ